MILVTGATGFVGRHLVEQLMQQGLPVRCLLPQHRANKLPWDSSHPYAPEVTVANLLNEEHVFTAVTGVHTIIHLENAQWWGRQRDLERIELSGTRNLIASARAARVGRIITLSQLGTTPASAYTLHRIKGEVEELVRNSGLTYTIIRSGVVYGEDDAFINNIAMMLRVNPLFFILPGRGEIVLHPIYIDDLIQALMSSLENIDILDRTIEIGGPEYTTLADLIRTVMRVTGMSRLLISIPPYLMRWITSVYSRMFPRALMTPQWLDILATNRTAPLGNTFNYFGFHPRRLEDTLLDYLPDQRHFLSLLRYTFRRRPRGL